MTYRKQYSQGDRQAVRFHSYNCENNKEVIYGVLGRRDSSSYSRLLSVVFGLTVPKDQTRSPTGRTN